MARDSEKRYVHDHLGLLLLLAKQKHPGCKKSAGPIRSVVIVDQNV